MMTTDEQSPPKKRRARRAPRSKDDPPLLPDNAFLARWHNRKPKPFVPTNANAEVEQNRRAEIADHVKTILAEVERIRKRLGIEAQATAKKPRRRRLEPRFNPTGAPLDHRARAEVRHELLRRAELTRLERALAE